MTLPASLSSTLTWHARAAAMGATAAPAAAAHSHPKGASATTGATAATCAAVSTPAADPVVPAAAASTMGAAATATTAAAAIASLFTFALLSVVPMPTFAQSETAEPIKPRGAQWGLGVTAGFVRKAYRDFDDEAQVLPLVL